MPLASTKCKKYSLQKTKTKKKQTNVNYEKNWKSYKHNKRGLPEKFICLKISYDDIISTVFYHQDLSTETSTEEVSRTISVTVEKLSSNWSYSTKSTAQSAGHTELHWLLSMQIGKDTSQTSVHGMKLNNLTLNL